MTPIKQRSPYQQRLLKEQENLAEKVTSLKGFIPTPDFTKLDPVDQGLLNSQLIYMKAYLLVLDQRIGRCDKELA